MIVVADTSPINYLVLIEQIDILAQLYRQVVIPSAVHRELQHAETPQLVQDWIANPPHWLNIRSIHRTPDSSLAGLDDGEAEAIVLAEEIFADRIIVDETLGRRAAQSHGLQVIGTLGILREASRRDLLDFRESVALLQKHGFHVAQRVLDDMLADS